MLEKFNKNKEGSGILSEAKNPGGVFCGKIGSRHGNLFIILIKMQENSYNTTPKVSIFGCRDYFLLFI
jgi:hypothetical protein